MRIGITGHMNLSGQTVPLVVRALREHLRTATATPLVGVSCLAQGSDSLFAEIVLELGGQLEVVLPSTNYREAKVKPDHAAQFDRLLSQAAQIRTMPFEVAGREAYEAANECVLDGIGELIAVWDGQSSPDAGGTGSVVKLARARGVAVHVIWPDGARRV